MTQSFTFQSIHSAYVACRRHKRASSNTQRYEMQLLDALMRTRDEVLQRQYHPATSITFAAQQPKAREVYAAHFADRVVHHWLVPRLECLYEPVFIHDVYSNRRFKGTHLAVRQLQSYMRAIQSQHGSGYFLQLDIHNFFNSIHKGILYTQLKQRLGKSLRQGKLTATEYDHLRWLCWRLLNHNPTKDVINKSTAKQWARVPAHKRLANASPQCGLPIGNLTSQFFANVYLNALDQFIKHQLKCRYYLRYVDDFVLLSHDSAQLLAWRAQIVGFLAAHLALQLKALAAPQPFAMGADFLGYIVRPRYQLVRHRVINHCRAKLHQVQQTAQITPKHWQFSVEGLQQIRAMLASYLGHFKHAHAKNTVARLWAEFPWLAFLFAVELPSWRLLALYQNLQLQCFKSQQDYFASLFPCAQLVVAHGFKWQKRAPVLAPLPTSGQAPNPFIDVRQQAFIPSCPQRLRVRKLVLREHGFLPCGIKNRVMTDIFI